MMSKWLAALLLAVALAGCAPAPDPGGRDGTREGQRQTGPTRLVAAVQGDVHTLYNKLNPRSAVPGIPEIEKLVATGLVTEDQEVVLAPRLAETVPTLENGQWKLLPDGRMETNWRIRQGAQWHDGAPFTSDDLVFTLKVGQDRELAVFRDVTFDDIERFETPDPRSITLYWRRPNIKADLMFGHGLALPLPRHILERPYLEEKETFADLPHWSSEWIGTGPYKSREFIRGSHMVLDANERYVMGRPKIDELTVKFIPDSNTLVANVLSGAVELTIGRGLSIDQGLQVRDRWRDGRVITTPSSIVHIHPQLLNPSPPIVADVQFRRALQHAVDRQELVDSILAGLAPIAHSMIHPDDPEYPHVQEYTVRYDYDPRRATQLIEALGYQRGADGFFRDAGGQRLQVEMRTTGDNDIHPKLLYPVVDYWQRVGVGVDPVIIPPQRQRDLEYRATFPGFEMLKGASSVRGLVSIHGSRAPLPENGYQVTGNYSRYMNPEYDALYEKYTITIPWNERVQVVGQAVRHLTERVIKISLLFDVGVALAHNRVQNVPPKAPTWNAQEWVTGDR